MNSLISSKKITNLLCVLLFLGLYNYCSSQVQEKGLSTYLKPINFVDTVQKSAFGTKSIKPFALNGAIYYLPQRVKRLPDFGKLQAVGNIYTTKLNIPKTKFRNGFPGVTDRFEWFAIDYKGAFYIKEKGIYKFKLASDDGSKLFINDKLVINNDGLHAIKTHGGSISLDKGVHKIEIQYFQGPREDIALSLFISDGNGKFKEFDTMDFFPGEIEFGEDELRINLEDNILFEYNKFDLKEEAKEILKEIKESFFDSYQFSLIIIEGHTDDTGTKEYNRNLSWNRAKSVSNYFNQIGINNSKLAPRAYGEMKPKYTNTNDINRSKNRRVEIVIK